jgi:hypothetical protein
MQAGLITSQSPSPSPPQTANVMTPKKLPITVTVSHPVLTTRCVLGEGEPARKKTALAIHNPTLTLIPLTYSAPFLSSSRLRLGEASCSPRSEPTPWPDATHTATGTRNAETLLCRH